MYNLFVAEDDAGIANAVAELGRAWGFEVKLCEDFSEPTALIEHGGAVLNKDEASLSFKGQKIPLSKNEYRILLCLMENRGKVVSRERLMETLWQTDQFVDENTLTVNVNRLRKKLTAAGLDRFIVTKFGMGYTVGD